MAAKVSLSFGKLAHTELDNFAQGVIPKTPRNFGRKVDRNIRKPFRVVENPKKAKAIAAPWSLTFKSSSASDCNCGARKALREAAPPSTNIEVMKKTRAKLLMMQPVSSRNAAVNATLPLTGRSSR